MLARLEAVALGYRRRALDNPDWFGLILGTPVPVFHVRATLPESLQGLLLRGWSSIHGLVMLGPFGHLAWSGIDLEELLRTEVRSIRTELPSAKVDTARPVTT